MQGSQREGEIMNNTQGKLRVGTKYATDIYADRAGHVIARTLNPQATGEDEANARRLVACWNECEGIRTEDLERGHIVMTASDLFQERENQRNELLQQNAVFLDAAKKAIRSLNELVVDDSEEAPAIQGARMRKQNAVRALGAAIKKTENKEQRMSNEYIPAFPQFVDDGESKTYYFGMQLRDYFAAKAMQIMWEAYDKGYCGLNNQDAPNTEIITKGAYQMADAMLEARKE